VAVLKDRLDLAMRASSLLKPKKQAPALVVAAEPARINFRETRALALASHGTQR
jgi:hypothetical protein